MRKVLLCAVIGMAALLCCGCGGGGDGGGDGGIDPGTSMIGAWQPVSATLDGAPTKVANVMPESNAATTHWAMNFKQDGTCTFQAYGVNGLLETFNGTWNSDNQIAPVTIAGGTTNIHWSDTGNIMTATYTLDGKPVVAKWVRISPSPNGHDAGWIGTWRAQTVEVNGSATPLGTWFEWSSGSDSELMELQANGVAVIREMAGTNVVDTIQGTWATTDGVMTWNYKNVTYWGYWEGQFLTFVILNHQTGDTVKMVWQKVT